MLVQQYMAQFVLSYAELPDRKGSMWEGAISEALGV